MDTIRTCYIDAANAVERNGSYVYDLQGGIAVPEGARVFICLLYTSDAADE